MSDDNTSDKDGQTGDGAGDFQAITSQEALDRALGHRLERERAKFADYDAIKAKAAEFDKATEANKTELQKERDRADAAEKLVGGFQQKEQVAKWAEDAVKGTAIPASALRGSTEDEIKAHFEQLKAIAAPVATTKRTATPTGKSDTDTGGSRAVAALRQYRSSAH